MPGIASGASILIGYIASGTTTLRVGSGRNYVTESCTTNGAEQFGTLDAP
jgi:alkanesulfonate monooxygenase SsuD/methylene tetrahydromethanopterin reductase-like flavin-dependent oxidoreductase (luciferase family)